MSFLVTPHDEAAPGVRTNADGEQDLRMEFQSIPTGCANLIASMVRITEEWTRQHEQEVDTKPVPPMGPLADTGGSGSRSASTISGAAGVTPGSQWHVSNMSSSGANIGTPASDQQVRGAGVSYDLMTPASFDSGMVAQSNQRASQRPPLSQAQIPPPAPRAEFNYLGAHPDATFRNSADYSYQSQPDYQQNAPAQSSQNIDYQGLGSYAPPNYPNDSGQGGYAQRNGQLDSNPQTGMDQYGVNNAANGTNYAPTALDFLVAQMFNYSYLPGPGQYGGFSGQDGSGQQ